MSAQGPDHAFHIPDRADRLEASAPWAPRTRRRLLVIAAIIVLAALTGVFAGVIDWMFQAVSSGDFGSGPGVSGVVLLIAAAGALWVDRLLYKATRPAFALPGEVYDERQQALNDGARRKSRWISYAVIAGLTALGAFGASPGVVLASGLAGFAAVMSGQQLVLAWTLERDDFDFDSDA